MLYSYNHHHFQWLESTCKQICNS